MYKRVLQNDTESEYESSDGRPVTRFALTCPLSTVRPHSGRFLESVTYQGPKIWAELPNQVKSLNDADSFDREVRRILHVEFLNSNGI